MVVLEGGVVADPELAFSSQGNAWLKLRIVCAERERDGTGQWVDGEKCYLTVVVLNKTVAENMAESVTKGDKVMVTGKLEMNEWEREGVKRVDYRVIADEIGVAVFNRPVRTERVKREEAPPADDPWSKPVKESGDEPPF